MLGGLRHRIEGVTSKNLSISSAFGAASPTSADDGHIYRNNTYKGSMTVIKYSTAENNTLTGNMSVQQGATATGNTVTGNMSMAQDATATGNTITGNVSTAQANVTITGNKVEGKVTASNKNATIQGNTVISTEEYAVYLSSSAANANNTVTNNDLKAAAKTGDEAVSSKSTSNTIKDNGDANKYTAKLKEGVQDADKWTIAPAEATTDGVYRNTTITVTYSGDRKVKSVKAVKKAAKSAEGHALSASAVGEIVGSDGKAYAVADKDNLPSGVTAVAMVAYKSGSNGLAIQLNGNPVSMKWAQAKTYAEGLTAVSGGTWRLPSKADWQNMFVGCAVSGDATVPDADSEMDPIAGFQAKIAAAGITWKSGDYWTSTGDDSIAWMVGVNLEGSYASASFGEIPSSFAALNVLGCLAF